MAAEPQTSVQMEVETDSGEAGNTDVTVSATARVGRGRVEQLSKLFKQQQEIIYSQKSISKHFSGDVLRVAEKCWQQIHPSINGAIETQYQKMFEEFGALQKLSKLDKLSSEQDASSHPWRPSGIPHEDYNTAAVVEATKLVPEFEKQYTEAQRLTTELQELIKARQQVLEDLQQQIRTSIEDLKAKTSRDLK